MTKSNRGYIIEKCKNTIAYRASSMALKFDRNDILVADCGSGNQCVFLKYYFDIPAVDENYNFIYDKHGNIVMEKSPNIWIEPPSRELISHRTRKEGQSFVTEFSIAIPKVHIRVPQLVFLVSANGDIKDGAVIGREIEFDLTGHR